MKSSKLVFGAVAVLLVIALGAAAFFLMSEPPSLADKEAASGNAPMGEQAVLTEAGKTETITPLKLEYSLKNFGPGQNAVVSYYFEKKQKCGSRDAYLGLAKLEATSQNFPSQYAKFSAFADNGELGVSNWTNEGNMAFDDATPYYNEMNIPLLASELFLYAGKNFNLPEFRQSESPIILKDVVSGRSKGNYSIIGQGEDASAIVPCDKFKIIAKTTNMDGYFNICVAKNINDINLPFMVYLNFENENGPSWQLKGISAQKSGIAWTPQCLETPDCVYVPEMPAAEQNQCRGRSGQVEPELDKSGCVVKYKCMTQDDRAAQSIAGMQPPSCLVEKAVLDKYTACIKNNQPNYDPVKYDENGCLQDIACRQ